MSEFVKPVKIFKLFIFIYIYLTCNLLLRKKFSNANSKEIYVCKLKGNIF